MTVAQRHRTAEASPDSGCSGGSTVTTLHASLHSVAEMSAFRCGGCWESHQLDTTENDPQRSCCHTRIVQSGDLAASNIIVQSGDLADSCIIAQSGDLADSCIIAQSGDLCQALNHSYCEQSDEHNW